MKSLFPIALLIFVCLNLGLRALYCKYLQVPASSVEQARAGKSVELLDHINDLSFWAWCLQPNGQKCVDSAVAYLHKQNPNPDVVILGTSQLEDPLWRLDRPNDQDSSARFFYHHCDSLAKNLGSDAASIQLISLATPYALLSDSYLYFERYLKGDWKPKVIVIGIQPRDLYDFRYLPPQKSANFYALTRFGLRPSERSEFAVSDFRDAQVWFSEQVFLYDKRQLLQQLLFKQILSGGHRLVNIARQLIGQAPKEPPTQPAASKKASLEYVEAYKGIGLAQLDGQLTFLKRILVGCRQLQIKVVIVNMPLTSSNLDLLPAGFYSSYLSTLSAISAEYGASFLNLDGVNSFSLDDFADGEHLNASGALKLQSKLVPLIRNR